MPPELSLALLFVSLVLAVTLYRWWQRKRAERLARAEAEERAKTDYLESTLDDDLYMQ